jgi:hypothetical protein
VNTASGASTTCPKLISAVTGRSDEKVFEPPSIIICPGFAVDTTVARIDAAQSSREHALESMVLRSLKI